MQPSDISFADAGELVCDVVETLLPAAKVNVADYATQHRWLINEGGGYTGRYRHEEAPYLAAPMSCLKTELHRSVALVGAAQCGKTVVAENWVLADVPHDPGDMLWYMQTDEGVTAYVKKRIDPLIDKHEELRRRRGLQPVDNSLHFKRFRGMTIEFLSAKMANLINKSAPKIVADEIDAYDVTLGDVKVLMDARRTTFGRGSMLLAMSHCDRATGYRPERGDWNNGIMSMYADSDRRVWYWPCPQCGAWSSPVPFAGRVMTLEYPEDATLDVVQREAHLLCPVNGCIIGDHERRGMNLAAYRSSHGGWIGIGQEISEGGTVTGELIHRDTAGFFVVGAMSTLFHGGIGELARIRAKAQREYEADGDDKTLRQVVVKRWGHIHTPPKSVGTIEAKDLADRAELALKRGKVPKGVRYIVIVVDCQAGRFEWLARGFGVKGESWVIDAGVILGDPATSSDDWDKLLPLFERAWPLDDDSGRAMKARGMGFDSGGQAGVTLQAYLAWPRWRKDRKVRFLGKAQGRDVFTIMPMKGASGARAPRLLVTYPETSRKANKRAGGGNVPIAFFNPNDFKDDLAGQLGKADEGPLYIHVPAAFRSQQADEPHAWFEQLTAEVRDKKGRWDKKTSGARNEALDLMVMSDVIAYLHGARRINWERPPTWADEWDRNAMVAAAPVEPDQTPPGEEKKAPAAKPVAKPAAQKKARKVARSSFMSRR